MPKAGLFEVTLSEALAGNLIDYNLNLSLDRIEGLSQRSSAAESKKPATFR